MQPTFKQRGGDAFKQAQQAAGRERRGGAQLAQRRRRQRPAAEVWAAAQQGQQLVQQRRPVGLRLGGRACQQRPCRLARRPLDARTARGHALLHSLRCCGHQRPNLCCVQQRRCSASLPCSRQLRMQLE